MRRRILFAAAAVLALAITSGCETAKNPATDATPPDVELKGYNNSSTATVTQQVGPVSSNYSTLVKLTFDAHGSDPGGVRKISITGNYTVTCGQITQSESVESKYQGGINQVNELPNVAVGETVFANLYTTYEIDFAAHAGDCSAPKFLKSVGGTVTATAENYHNGKTTTKMFTFKATT
jgi:hypothetical protein